MLVLAANRGRSVVSVTLFVVPEENEVDLQGVITRAEATTATREAK